MFRWWIQLLPWKIVGWNIYKVLLLQTNRQMSSKWFNTYVGLTLWYYIYKLTLSSSMVSIWAPLSTRFFTVFIWPPTAAMCRGVTYSEKHTSSKTNLTIDWFQITGIAELFRLIMCENNEWLYSLTRRIICKPQPNHRRRNHGGSRGWRPPLFSVRSCQ